MTMMKIFKAEILAPVGNNEMLLAAVRSGADAVYLGAEDFNARRNAENFSAEALAEAISYCKKRGVKVYLTLNTSLRDDELGRAVSVAENAYKAGIDAVIIADLGLARLLRARLPGLPLHASTQLSVHSASALNSLKKLGFSRVVLAREMSKENIKEFVSKASELGIETEVFVHGALCMSVSGQCMLSSVIGGRSGNRGLCAGPCRLPFAIGNKDYALSLKDLSLLDFAKELSDMGVTSLKIEGRMKRPEYVAAAVSAFSAALKGENTAEIAKKLQRVFSRSGFTSGYYENRLGSDMFGIRTKEDVKLSNDVLSSIHSLYRAEMPRVAVSFSVVIKAKEEIKLTMSDGENSVTILGAVPEMAKNKALDTLAVENALKKLGSTPYFAEKTEIVLEDGLFLSGAQLNELRRNAVEALDKLRIAQKPIEINENELEIKEKRGGEQKTYCRFENAEQVPENLEGIDLIVLPLFADFETLGDQKTPLAAEVPRGILNEVSVAKRLEKIKEFGVNIAFCGTLAAMELAKDKEFEVIADIGFNIYNSHSANLLENLGASGVMLSPELKIDALKAVKSPIERGYFAYGRLPVMLTRNCPVNFGDCNACDKRRSLTDRTGAKFPVNCGNGFSVVYNSAPHYLADKAEQFLGLDFKYLYFTFEEKEEAKRIIEAYKKEKKPSGEFTRGLYFREVY